MTKKTIKIQGMTCASCAQAVERSIRNLDGIEDASVNLATEKLNVSFDESKVSYTDIKKTIEKAGYKAIQETVSKTLKIEGMTCASCAQAVERVTSRLDGVTKASVNLATEKLSISYEPGEVGVLDLIKVIENAGYKVIEGVTNDIDRDYKEKERKALWKKFVISAIFTVPLLYISMGPMIWLPIPNFIDPMINPLVFALVQLILTSPVVVVGYKYYTVGFRTLFKGNPNMDSLIAVSTSAAFVYGLFAIFKIIVGEEAYAMELYFESAAVILTLITLGKYMEIVSKGKTSEAIKSLWVFNLKQQQL